jgi:predicted transposase YdaD
LYNTLAEARHDSLVQTVLLLLRREADSPYLTGEYRRGFSGEEPYRVFRYRVVRLWQEPVERLLTGGLGLVALAPLSDEAPAEIDRVIGRMDDRFRAEAETAEANDLWVAGSLLMGLRYPRELIRQILERVRAMKESVTYQMILEEGEAKGRAEGAIEEARHAVLDLGQERFGEPPEEVRAAVMAMSDLGRLRTLTRRLVVVSDWAELLATP